MINLKRLRKQFLYTKYYNLFKDFEVFLLFNNTTAQLRYYLNFELRKKESILILQVKNQLIKQYFSNNCLCKNFFIGEVSIVGLTYDFLNKISLILIKLVELESKLLFLGILYKVRFINKKFNWYFTGPLLNVSLIKDLQKFDNILPRCLIYYSQYHVIKLFYLIHYNLVGKVLYMLYLKK